MACPHPPPRKWTRYAYPSTDEAIHEVPQQGIGHQLSASCWCSPKILWAEDCEPHADYRPGAVPFIAHRALV